ncbi:MAG: hypothetical protein U1E25_08420 [Methylocystis sp.]
MRETPLSDWTPIAYFQREEARLQSEQNSARAASPGQERPNNDEKQLSDVTVASMQRRFLLLERRLAILEQREHERQIREKLEAAPAQPQSQTPLNDAAYLGAAVSPIGNRRENHSQAKTHPEFTYTRAEKPELIDHPKTSDMHVQAHASESPSTDKGTKPSKDFVEIRPSSGEPVEAGLAHRIAAAFSSFVVTAFVAGSIGFLAAVLTVPRDRAVQFHALLNIAANAISDASHRK